MGLFIGRVVSTNDPQFGGRIKVRIEVDDKTVADKDLPYAFPFLPKMFNIPPKVDESVIILTKGEDSRTQRFYVGPVISQPQKMYKDLDLYSSSSMLNGGVGNVLPSIDRFASAEGTMPSEDELYISGRKNSDIIISDNDIRIRCGAKIVNPNTTNPSDMVMFNKMNPSYIKMNFYETPLISGENEINGSTNIVSDYINLLSTNGTPFFDGLTDAKNKQISDETLKKIIEKAHPLVFGDNLVAFLKTFVKAFMNHTHNYHNLSPVLDSQMMNLSRQTTDLEKILSKRIRIN